MPRKFKHGRKTLLIAVLLSVLLLLLQIFYALNLQRMQRISMSQVYNSLNAESKRTEWHLCMKTYLGSKRPPSKPPDTCEHPLPPRGLCSVIQDLFYNSIPESCDHQKQVLFCEQENLDIRCHKPKICGANSTSVLGVFDSTKGEIIWKKTPFSRLEEKLMMIVKKDDYQGFVFIKCTEDAELMSKDSNNSLEEYESDVNSELTQLFLFPPMKSRNIKNVVNETKYINLNFVMVDSLSRNHFYRSLPQTVAFFDEIKEKSANSVLDFEFLQAIKQRTYESLEVLFAGYVDTNETPFGTYEMPKKPLPLHILLSKLKKKDYKTLWLEDLCWSWEWGLSKDLKVMNKTVSASALWKEYASALRKAGIDGTDITLASCEILRVNGRQDPFHETPSICFNSKHHHEYILEYLKKYMEYFHRVDKGHLFSFTQLNVAHEESGVRIQSLDIPLRNFLQYSFHLENTLTVLFSDHGSTYGEFLRKSQEAYMEIFNPLLIFLIPNGVRKFIGDIRVRVMSDNQKHLVSLLDLHEMVLGLLNMTNENADVKFKEKYVMSSGLLGSIPPSRNCRDLPLLSPNLCICKNFDLIVSASALHYGFAEFAVSKLNNRILSQRGDEKGYGNCQLMLVKKISQVRELRTSADVTVYKIIIEVFGILSADRTEMFLLTVEAGRTVSPALRLLSYERINKFAPFQLCQDKSVETQMCVCHTEMVSPKYFSFLPRFPSFARKGSEISRNQLMKFFEVRNLYMTSSVEGRFPLEQPCIYITVHRYEAIFYNIYAISLCPTDVEITLKINFKNFLLSGRNFDTYKIREFDVRLLISGSKELRHAPSYWSYEVAFRII